MRQTRAMEDMPRHPFLAQDIVIGIALAGWVVVGILVLFL